MNSQQGSNLERLADSKSWPLAEDGEVAATEGRWSANLRQKRRQYRCFDVVTPEGSFVIEYRGEAMADEYILVDGRVAGRGRSTWWYSPHFRFRIGSADAALAVRYWPWLTLRWLRLIVGGQILYAEGSAGRDLSADDLLEVLSDPLLSDGIEINGSALGSVPMPRNITSAMQATGVTLTQRRFSWTAVMMVPFCLLLDAMVAGAYFLMPKGDLTVVAIVFLLPGILLALWASYYLLARLINSRVVTVTARDLSIRQGPLPWPGDRIIPISQVKEFHCERHTSRNYAGDAWETYTLSADLEDGQEIELVREIETLGAARILEQQILSWLASAQQVAAPQMAV